MHKFRKKNIKSVKRKYKLRKFNKSHAQIAQQSKKNGSSTKRNLSNIFQ